MLVIPAIDIIDNKIVRLTKGNYTLAKNYNVDVLNQVQKFEDIGFNFVHIIDLLASKEATISTFNLLSDIIRKTKLQIQFGGGIRCEEDVEKLFDIGVNRVIIGSMSINNKPLFEKIISKNKLYEFVIAADVKNNSVMIKGWTEDSSVNIFNHIEYCCSLGLNNFLCTDIDKDGMLSGVNVKLYKEIKEAFPHIFLIASGGISSTSDVKELSENNINSCVVGKAIYEGKISLQELKKYDN